MEYYYFIFICCVRERERNASYFHYFLPYAFSVFLFALSFVIDNNTVVTAAVNANSQTKNWKVYSCCCAVSCIRMALGRFLFSSSPSSHSSLLSFFNFISLALRFIVSSSSSSLQCSSSLLFASTRPVHLQFRVRARPQMYREVSGNVENQKTRRRYITSPCSLQYGLWCMRRGLLLFHSSDKRFLFLSSRSVCLLCAIILSCCQDDTLVESLIFSLDFFNTLNYRQLATFNSSNAIEIELMTRSGSQS